MHLWTEIIYMLWLLITMIITNVCVFLHSPNSQDQKLFSFSFFLSYISICKQLKRCEMVEIPAFLVLIRLLYKTHLKCQLIIQCGCLNKLQNMYAFLFSFLPFTIRAGQIKHKFYQQKRRRDCKTEEYGNILICYFVNFTVYLAHVLRIMIVSSILYCQESFPKQFENQ